MEVKVKNNIGGYNVLVTEGDEKKINVKDLFSAQIWIHNNILKKNHTFLYEYEDGRFMTEEEIAVIVKGKIFDESRIQILDRLSVKWGKKDDVKNFDEFCKFYNSDAITQLVYIAMHEYARQEIRLRETKEVDDNWEEKTNSSELTHEDFDLGHKIVNDIVDNTNVKDIKGKIEDFISSYEGNKKRKMLYHISALFLNIELNELHWRCKEARERSIEGRMITKQLNEI